MAVNLSSSGIASQNASTASPQAPTKNGSGVSSADTGTGPRTSGAPDSARAYSRPGANGSSQVAGGTVDYDPNQQRQAEAFRENIDQFAADDAPLDSGGLNGTAASNGSTASSGSNAANGQPATPGDAEAEKAAFQKQIFSSFSGDVDKARQERLSTWLPDLLNGDAAALKEAAKGLTHQQASDLNSLALTKDIRAIAVEAPSSEPGGGSIAGAISKMAAPANNIKALQAMQQRFGEHALTEATPGLAPSASYDVNTTLQVSKDQVYENFVSGLDEATKESLATWLPDALADRDKLPKDPNAEQGAGLHALAEAHGFGDADALQRSVVEAYDRAVAVETAAELPTVVDMMLVRHDGEYSRDVAFELNVAGDDIAARVKLYEDRDFGALDSWLPDALAGKGSIPTDDPEAIALLGKFAEDMGMAGGATATPQAAFDFIEQTDVFDKALHAGETGDSAYLLFSDKFLDNVIAYGEKHGAVNDAIEADAARAAEMLLGPDDGSSAARPFNTQALMAAMLHRTDQPLSRPQELQAASGYINKAETLAQQKERLADTLIALHTREEVGIGPMTPRTWAEAFAEISPEIVGKLNERAFNSPTGEKMQIITQHLGVPGDHEFMIDERRKIQISNDEMGNVESFDQDKKKKGTFKKILDVAIPVVATVLTFTPLSAVGVAMNVAYSAYKGAEAIKEGDLLGGALAIAGAVSGGAAGYLSTAGSAAAGAANFASNVAKGVNIANSSLDAHRAIKDGDYLGALTSGLSGAAGGGAGQGFQTAATGINAGRALEQGDYLAAGAGFASVASDLSRPVGTGIERHTDASLTYNTLSQGLNLAQAIDDKNYAGIGGALSNGIQQFGENYQDQQKIEEIEAKQAALEVDYDIPQDPFAAPDDPNLGGKVQARHDGLNRAADELDREISDIDKDLARVSDPAVANELLDQRAELQTKRDVVQIGQDSLRRQTHALAANDAYNFDGKTLGDNAPIERLDAEGLIEEGFDPELLQDTQSGYSATVYRDKATGEIIIANRGSEMHWNDWVNNVGQAFGQMSPQYQQAIHVADEARNAFGDNVVFTGHSLGGGLASAQALKVEGQASIFNPAGLHDNTLDQLGFTREEAQNFVNTYHIKGEPLNFLQDYLGLGPLDAAPDAVGNRHTLPSVNESGDAVGFLRFLLQTGDLHGSVAARQALNDHFRHLEQARLA